MEFNACPFRQKQELVQFHVNTKSSYKTNGNNRCVTCRKVTCHELALVL